VVKAVADDLAKEGADGTRPRERPAFRGPGTVAKEEVGRTTLGTSRTIS
jgi:hypothetical protein